MQLIPVVDLRGGQVVHARRGERAAYRPIISPLVSSSLPMDVVAGLLALAPFRTLYVADLDAITGQGGHDHMIRALRAAFPQLELWVDAGARSVAQAAARAEAGLGTCVVGTESLTDPAEARALLARPDVVLSLDHDAHGPMDPSGIHGQPKLWPARVIAMTLARVGASAGPDLETLEALGARRPGGALYAAGGVRDEADLAHLAQMGVAGALVASALHDGRIPAEAARRYA